MYKPRVCEYIQKAIFIIAATHKSTSLPANVAEYVVHLLPVQRQSAGEVELLGEREKTFRKVSMLLTTPLTSFALQRAGSSSLF